MGGVTRVNWGSRNLLQKGGPTVARSSESGEEARNVDSCVIPAVFESWLERPVFPKHCRRLCPLAMTCRTPVGNLGMCTLSLMQKSMTVGLCEDP